MQEGDQVNKSQVKERVPATCFNVSTPVLSTSLDTTRAVPHFGETLWPDSYPDGKPENPSRIGSLSDANSILDRIKGGLWKYIFRNQLSLDPIGTIGHDLICHSFGQSQK